MHYVGCSLFWNNFHLQTDEDPNTVLTLQAFEIIAQHEDFGENRPNVLTLTNGPAQVKISWKDFKDYNYVIDVSMHILQKVYKDHIFWEDHKILQNLHLTFEWFDWHYTGQN